MEIKLYCIKGFTGSALKSKLESALTEHNLPYQIDEINDTEDFIREGISSIPAIKVLDKVITHYEKSNIDDTVQMVLNVLEEGCDRNIMVPVDFTPESVYALRYARMMASHLGLGIIITHIHEPLIDPLTGTSLDIVIMRNDRDRLAKLLIEVGWDQMPGKKHIPVTTHFDIGDVKSHIFNLASSDKVKLIVMGTQAENSFLKRLQGSVSTHVARISPKPVIVVPIGVPLIFPERIIVGISNELLQDKVFNYLFEFAASGKSFLNFVYISNDEAEYNRLKFVVSSKSYDLKYTDLAFSVDRIPVDEENIHDALTKFATDTKAGMIVLATHYRSFLESLGHRSTSKKMLLEPVLPLLILHGHHVGGLGITNYLYDVIKEG